MPFVQKPDENFLQVETYTFPISNSVAVRIYSSAKPHNLKIADLQKGLILVYNGIETVGEGTGFGLPVLVYSDETYFSAASKVYISQHENSCIIRKEYVMDRIARNRLGNVTLENRKARTLLAYLADLYQRYPQFRFLPLKGVTKKMQIGTAFIKAVSMGRVTATYTINNSCIMVKTDFRDLKRKKLEKIFVLNEQGARFFGRYIDSHGTELRRREIGAWDGVLAGWACLKVLRGEFGFRLWKIEDCVLRMGRESLNGSLDWIGLDYEVNPKNDVFEYAVEILGV